MKKPSWQTILFVFLTIILASSFLLQLTAIPIRIWDEGRLANNAQHMRLHGNWLVTFYDDQPDLYNTKPPLLIWLQAGLMHIFGMNELSVRLPSALASIFIGLWLWFVSKKYLSQPWTGFLAGCVFASTYAWVYNHAGRTGDYDALMTFFIVSYCFCYLYYLEYGNRKWLTWFWIFLTLAVLTKSVAALLFLPALAAYTLLTKKTFTILKEKYYYSGFIFFILVIAAWYFIREKASPGYLDAVYTNELGGRYLGVLDEHRHPFWYYYEGMKNWRNTYWFYFILPAFFAGFVHADKKIKKITLFSFLIVISYWLIISFGKTKLEWYDLPMYPFLALQTGILFYSLWQLLVKILPRFLKPFVALVLFATIFFVPFRQIEDHIHHFREKPWDVEQERQAWLLHEWIKEKKDLGNYIFCYEGYHAQVIFYIRKLQAEGMPVQFDYSVENIPAGKIVVVSEQKLKDDLLAKYSVKKIDERFGCVVYFVNSKL